MVRAISHLRSDSRPATDDCRVRDQRPRRTDWRPVRPTWTVTGRLDPAGGLREDPPLVWPPLAVAGIRVADCPCWDQLIRQGRDRGTQQPGVRWQDDEALTAATVQTEYRAGSQIPRKPDTSRPRLS
jgi:hypothetical protein